nr:uncharacterized protein CTRU02_02560 [Colletotrichum truncatum]KAF6798586.1 hypothetical protein CTRU02_02560 [Colletotrichum truncatum]
MLPALYHPSHLGPSSKPGSIAGRVGVWAVQIWK